MNSYLIVEYNAGITFSEEEEVLFHSIVNGLAIGIRFT
jgi:hypothetical protein